MMQNVILKQRYPDRSSVSRVGLSLLQSSRLSQSKIITQERGAMRQMSPWMLFLTNTARLSATFTRCTASEVRASQSRSNATMYNTTNELNAVQKRVLCSLGLGKVG